MINVTKPTQVKTVVTAGCRNYDSKIICECYEITFKNDTISIQKTKNYPALSIEDKAIFEQILHSYINQPLSSNIVKELASKIQGI